MISLFAEIKFFRFWPKTMDYSPWFDSWESQTVLGKVCHFEVNEKRNLMLLV